MDDRTKRQREVAIFAAAYAQLAEHGYGGASMLRIAKAAKASNETLYRWYGDKDGLFTAMVRDNAAQTRALLCEALEEKGEAWAALEAVAPIFLGMILGDRAILLNRAAAADASGALGAAIATGGRGEVMPLLVQLMARVCVGSGNVAEQAAEWFLGLLLGDLQIRRVIGQQNCLASKEIDARCATALTALRRLLDASNGTGAG